MKRILLSVDWDFFFPEHPEWDFSHSEGFHPALEDALWHSRASGMLHVGKDLRELTAAHSSIAPEQFWNELEALGYDLSGARIAVAESHKAAAQFFLTTGLPLGTKILHVDAHHDLGYGSAKELRDYVKKCRVEAGNWLGVLLSMFPHVLADVVWPQWKTHVEDDFARAPISKKVRSRVTSSVWPAPSCTGGKVTDVFVCRSGAWVPPWHDTAFDTFIEDLSKHTASEATLVESVRERAFSMDAVEKDARILRAFHNKLGRILNNAPSE